MAIDDSSDVLCFDLYLVNKSAKFRKAGRCTDAWWPIVALHGKPYFLFPDVLKRWSSQKDCAGIRSFLYYWEGWYFFFSKIWSYALDGNERWSFLKNTRKYDIFFRPSEKMVFPKRAAPAHDLSCIIWKDGIFSPKNTIFFSLGRKWNTVFLGNTWKHDSLPSCEKKSMLFNYANN